MRGTNDVDDKLALLHGSTAPQVDSLFVDEVDKARIPALIVLIRGGLRATDTLAEAGWVSTRALPIIGIVHGKAEDGSAMRLLGPNELADARRLATTAFGVPEEVGAIVFADAILERQECCM